MPEDDEPGERGGHAEWSGADAATLPVGKYIMNVHHENVTYPEKYDSRYNISSCYFSLTATKKVRPTTIYAEARCANRENCVVFAVLACHAVICVVEWASSLSGL